MTPGELERRLSALERRVPGSGTYGSPGISTAFGAAGTNYRDRFPAVLTSTFDSLTGYSWARLILDRTTSTPSVVEVAANPQAGSYAFTPDNDETLAVGDRGWLEADPNAGGWIFLKPSASESACSTACDSLDGLLDTWCLRLELVCAAGEFADMDAGQFAGVFAFGVGGTWTFKKWDGDSWEPFDFEWFTGSSGSVIFTWLDTPEPTLTAGGIELRLDCLKSEATFVGGPRQGFDGDPAIRADLEPCADNTFVLRVSCTCCPIDGWEGDGWYCIVSSTQTCGVDTPTCVELREEFSDHCNAAIQLCSGRYDTPAECAASCTGAASGPLCTATPVSAVMAVTAGAGPCATSMNGLSGSISAFGGDWQITFEDSSSSTRTVQLFCADDVWTASKPFTDTCQGSLSCVVTVIDSTHLKITTTFGGAFCSDCDGETISVEITVTLTP